MKNSKSYIIIVFIFIGVATFMLINQAEISRLVLLDCRNELIVNANELSDQKTYFVRELMPTLFDDEPCIVQSYSDDADYEIKDYDDYTDTEAQLTEMVALTTQESTDADTEEAVAIMTTPGIEYSMEQLSDFDFLISNCYAIDHSTSVKEEEMDAETLLSKDMSIDTESEDYKVLIYHTHGSETFADSRDGVIEDSVIGVGDELARILEEQYGIRTYHDRNVYDMVDGVLDRNYAYDLSGEAARKIIEEHPSIEVVIDLHRDGVREDLHLVRVINGRPTAQIMFLNGVSRLNVNGDVESMYNPNKIDNLSFSLQLHLAGKKMYGDLMRRIYISGYRFNLDILPRATLIEIGAQNNTVEEAKNAMIPLAAILNDVLSGASRH